MKRQNRMARARPSTRSGSAIPPEGVEQDLVIDAVGSRGDALARHEGGGPLYAPFALPGEVVRARVLGERAEVLSVLSPSPERRAPACAHFGRCGGCQLQHWDEAPYLTWKRSRVVEALERVQLGPAVEETIPAWGAGRRRAAFHAARQGGQVRVGFVERGGARLTPVSACPALASELEAALPVLRVLAEGFLPARGEMTLQCLATETGLDVAIKGAGRVSGLDRAALERAARAAEEGDLARLSIDGEPIVMRRTPLVRMGAARVIPPPGAFLQPTVQGEMVLASLALAALDGAKRAVDLFSGIGTFALRLAERAQVQAVESDQGMLDALKAAADGAGGALRDVQVLRRDLLRTPFSALELKKFDAAIIDPPRSGARLQAEQLGRSGVRKLAYVSCDPLTFARDVKVLVTFGFALTRVTPVDQFRWSPHVEVVGALER